MVDYDALLAYISFQGETNSLKSTFSRYSLISLLLVYIPNLWILAARPYLARILIFFASVHHSLLPCQVTQSNDSEPHFIRRHHSKMLNENN